MVSHAPGPSTHDTRRDATHNTQYRNAGPLTPRARHTCTVYAVPYGDWVDLFRGGWLARTATKRSVVHNANPGIAPPPCAWSIEMGQCSAARTPPRAVRPSRWRDQEAARSNRRESLVSVPVTSQWCAQEAADQAVRVHHGLPVANMVEGHQFMKVCSMLLAAVSAPRV